jgi:tRNA-(ms[2]io[6]A)-hydroxylase
MESEGSLTTFISYARNMEPNRCRKRWREWIEYEASIIANYGKRAPIHG